MNLEEESFWEKIILKKEVSEWNELRKRRIHT